MQTGIKPAFGVKDYGSHLAICLRYKISKQNGQNIAELFGLKYDESTHDCIKLTGIIEHQSWESFKEMVKSAQLVYQVELAKRNLRAWEEHIGMKYHHDIDPDPFTTDELPF